MYDDFYFLWVHRERPSHFDRWLIVWGKRVFHSLNLLRLLVAPVILRSKGAIIGRLVFLGKARIEGAISNLTIGDEVSLGRCHIALHDRVVIGRRAVVNDGVQILTASHSLSDPRWTFKKAPIVIGEYAWVATNAILLPGVSIGVGAVVGAGAVVRENVPDRAVVVGNPAQSTAARRSSELSYSPVLLNAPFEAWIGSAE